MKKSPARVWPWIELGVWVFLIFHLSGESFQSSRTLIALQFWLAFLGIPITQSVLVLLNHAVRKLAHFTEYFILSLLFYRAVSGGLSRFRFRLACLTIAVCVLFAVSDEFHQIFVRHRTASLWDALLDSSGVLASQIFIFARSLASRPNARAVRTP